MTALASYALMSDTNLEFSPFFTENDGMYNIMAGEDLRSEPLILDPDLLVRPRDLLGRGVTVYRAKKPSDDNWQYVVKFVWRNVDEMREETFLRRIKNRGIWGVVKLLDQQTI